METALLVFERVLKLSQEDIGAISVLCAVLAAAIIGVMAAVREWPRDWIVFAIILIVVGQLAVAVVLQIDWPAREGTVEHGYFNVFYMFFLGMAANLAGSIGVALLSYWLVLRSIARGERRHAS